MLNANYFYYNPQDHICCIVDQNLEENGDFESFYHKTIKQFYQHHLREIEEETANLLTFKNYYAMKKVMKVSGILSVLGFIGGSFLKIAHLPGAGALLFCGMLVLAFCSCH